MGFVVNAVDHSKRSTTRRPQTFQLQTKGLAHPSWLGGQVLDRLEGRARDLLWQSVEVSLGRWRHFNAIAADAQCLPPLRATSGTGIPQPAAISRMPVRIFFESSAFERIDNVSSREPGSSGVTGTTP